MLGHVTHIMSVSSYLFACLRGVTLSFVLGSVGDVLTCLSLLLSKLELLGFIMVCLFTFEKSQLVASKLLKKTTELHIHLLQLVSACLDAQKDLLWLGFDFFLIALSRFLCLHIRYVRLPLGAVRSCGSVEDVSL